MNYTKDQFRLEMLHYLDENWRNNITLEQIASAHGYSGNYFNTKFKECFGLPFLHYMNKMKLHRAAAIISQNGTLMNIGKMIGYSTAQSFSKAFRKEFGISPKQFLQSEEEIPDMPVSRKIGGETVRVEYITEPEVMIHGQMLYPIHGNDTDLHGEVGYYYDYICTDLEMDCREDKIEMWWHDERCNIRYVIGTVAAEGESVPEGKISMVIPKDYYAVISVKYGTCLQEGAAGISRTIKGLTQFAFEEWKIANAKNLRQMGCTFIKYKGDEVSIYIPVYKRNVMYDGGKPKFKGASEWIQYIDNNLKRNLKVKDIADAFNYSERHFTDTFEMYFGIRPGLYVKKRRLYLVAKELRDGANDLEKLVEAYGFHSLESFRRSFLEEFSWEPEEYEGDEYKVENLRQYYTYHKSMLQFQYEEIKDFTIAGKNISSAVGIRGDRSDLIDAIAWALQYDFLEKKEAGDEACKVVVWQTVKERKEHNCLVGPEIPENKIPEDGYNKMKILGGYYIVMETPNETDKEALAENYRMLYRCAFGGWIRENQERVDLMRLTFVKYKNEKLYFYIPIYA